MSFAFRTALKLGEKTLVSHLALHYENFKKRPLFKRGELKVAQETVSVSMPNHIVVK